MVTARTAAMAFNRYVDRDIDSRNERTRQREIPGGVIAASSAMLLVFISSIGFVITTYFINRICFYLSPVALAVVLGYSYTKRFTWLCHLVLGVGLSLAPIGAYLAVTGSFDTVPLLFSATVITWVSGFDIIYAMQDAAFDRAHSLYSMPAFFGGKNALRISSVLHLLSFLFVAWIGILQNYSWIYGAGVVYFTLLLIYQHKLVKPDDLSKVNVAFFTLNGVASVIFACFVVAEILLGR